VYYTSKFYSSNSKEASDIWFEVSEQNGTEVIKNHELSDKFRVYNVSRGLKSKFPECNLFMHVHGHVNVHVNVQCLCFADDGFAI